MRIMDWRSDLKRRYANEGWEALRAADVAFKKRLERLIAAQGLAVIDDNPEGEDWVVRLKNGEELYVDRTSYDMEDGRMLWIEYKPELGSITAEIFDVDGQLREQEVVVPKSEIADVSNDWR